MAANSEELKVVEELHQILQTLYNELVRAYKECLLQRRRTECCVRRCRKLLKPWPSFNKDGIKEGKHVPETEVKTEAPQQDQEGPVADPDLQILDKILAKAQHAREIQKKIDEGSSSKVTVKKVPERSASRKDVCRPGSVKVSKPQAVNTKAKPSKVVPSITKPITTKPQSSTRPLSAKPMVKQPVLLKRNVAKAIPLRTTYGASYGKKAMVKSVAGSAKDQKSAYLNSVMDKPRGATASKRESRSQESTKPQKIAPSSQVPRKKEMICKDSNLERIFSANSRTINANVQDDLRSQEIKECEDIFVDKEPSLKETTVTSTEKEEGHLYSEVERREREGTSRTADSDIQDFNTRLSSIQNSDTLSIDDANDVQQFNLIEDGNKLTLPKKYRKLKTSNSKLVSKVQQLVKDTSEYDASRQFVGRLEQNFDWMNEISHRNVETEARSLLEAHEQLSLFARSVVERSMSLQEMSGSWEVVYKCYRGWQVVLSKFRELQKRTQDLLTAEELLHRCCPCGGCSEAKLPSPRHTDHASTSQTTKGRGGKEGRGGRDGCVFMNTWLPPEFSQPEEGSGTRVSTMPEMTYAVQEMTYADDKELRILNRSIHEAQRLTLELHVQRRVSQAALALLSNLKPTHRLYVPLYRLLYGLLCCEGKAFPSMVVDGSTE